MSIQRQYLSDGLSRERIKLELRRSVRPVITYIAAAAVALTAFGILLSHVAVTLPWQHPRSYQIAVPDAAGVQPGVQEVRISGLKVGQITGLRLTGGQAVLTISVDNQYPPLYRNAQVELRPQTPLQDMYLDIVSRGTPTAGVLRGGQVLPAGRANLEVDTGIVLDAFDAPVRARLQTLIDELSAGMADHGAQLRGAFVALAPFLNATASFSRQFAIRGFLTRRLVHNLTLLTGVLGSREGELTRLVADGAATLSATSATGPQLSSTIAQLPPTLTQLQSTFATLRAALGQVDPALTALRPAAAALAPGLRALRRIAVSANPALIALQAPVQRLRPLAQSLPATAYSLRGGLATLLPQAPRLDRITAKVVDCETALQGFFQNTPSVFKLSDAYGVLPRGDGAFGTELTGGLIHDPSLTFGPSCTGGA